MDRFMNLAAAFAAVSAVFDATYREMASEASRMPAKQPCKNCGTLTSHKKGFCSADCFRADKSTRAAKAVK